MTRSTLQVDALPAPAGPFSVGVLGDGLLFLSGQIGQDPRTGRLVGGGLEAEAHQLFENLAATLAAAHRTFDDVVRVGVYLTEPGDFAPFNALYARRFAGPYPARTLVIVRALPLGARVEVELVVSRSSP